MQHPAVSTGGAESDAGAGISAAVSEQPARRGASPRALVVVTGAAGFVGTHVCRSLTGAGWPVRAIVRDQRKAAARLGSLPVELRTGDLRDEPFVRDALTGAAAVVHLAAIAVERHGESYEEVNTGVTALLLGAAAAAGATRFVHFSQNGADALSGSRFLRSKGLAEELVQRSALHWTVLRPSVIFGPEDEFANVLARIVRLTPAVLPLPGGGRALFQPVFVDDVATVVRIALERDATSGHTYPLGGPAALSLREMTERILTAMRSRRWIVSLPISVAHPLVALAARVLPRPPVTPALLDLLALDNTVPDNAITTAFGITPVPFAPEELLYLRAITAREALASLFGPGY